MVDIDATNVKIEDMVEYDPETIMELFNPFYENKFCQNELRILLHSVPSRKRCLVMDRIIKTQPLTRDFLLEFQNEVQQNHAYIDYYDDYCSINHQNLLRIVQLGFNIFYNGTNILTGERWVKLEWS